MTRPLDLATLVLPAVLRSIVLPSTSEPLQLPAAYSPNAWFLVIVLPLPLAVPPTRRPCAACSLTPLPVLRAMRLPEMAEPVSVPEAKTPNPVLPEIKFGAVSVPIRTFVPPLI